ncbi:hypothetical protein [Infirmifilum sp. SLHALR2]|nr:MAG: hypothetical protein B7L53_01670 [Thermofilum sp. NZ13]
MKNEYFTDSMRENLASYIVSFLQNLLFRAESGYGYFYGYDLARNKPIEPVYCEVTGYGLSFHSFLSALTGDVEHLDLVKLLAEFLMVARSKVSGSAILYGFYPSKDAWSSLAYSFDNGVVAKAFFDAYRALNSKKYLDHGLRISEWLVSAMQRSDGGFAAAYDYGEKGFIDFNTWYGNGGCLHGKLAIPLLTAWKLSGDDRFRDSAEKLLAWLLKLQMDNGAFRAREDTNYVFHHTHCYALEGFLYAWHELGDDRYLDVAVRGAKWLARIQHRSGGLPDLYPYPIFVRRLVTDATAQAIRIWLILHKITGNEFWLMHAEKGLGFLKSIMFRRARAHGALPAHVWYPLYSARRTHTWSMMFAAQAFVFSKKELSLSEMMQYLF